MAASGHLDNRRRGLVALVAASAGVFVPGCGGGGPASSPAPHFVRAKAPPLARIQDERSRLLDTGTAGFKSRLASLRGHPIVVNQWASWCPPCRQEFPFFQRLAARYGNRIAFLGVNSNDRRGAATAFLRKFPTPYPHYFDPDTKIARSFRGGAAWPTTAFYTASGSLAYSHPGGYRNQADLLADIRRYTK